MISASSFSQVNWHKEAKSPAEKAKLLTSQILSGLPTNFDSKKWKELLALRDEAKHEVNQGSRAIINVLVCQNWHNITDEVSNILESVAKSVISKLTYHVDVEDIIQTAWLKVVEKFAKFEHLQQSLASNNRVDDFGKDDLEGIFNPLCGDFLTWFVTIADRKHLDAIKHTDVIKRRIPQVSLERHREDCKTANQRNSKEFEDSEEPSSEEEFELESKSEHTSEEEV